ncbi:hypothetical protein SLA2020_457790 [Shorea laevis]
MEAASGRHAFPLRASISGPSFTAASSASVNDSTFGANVKPNSSSSTTIVPLMLGNLDAITGVPLIIASNKTGADGAGGGAAIDEEERDVEEDNEEEKGMVQRLERDD